MPAVRWVDPAIGCGGFASLIAAAVTVHLMLAEIRSPGDGMEIIGAIAMSGFCAGIGTTFMLLLVLLRHLLHKAVEQRPELAEVI